MMAGSIRIPSLLHAGTGSIRSLGEILEREKTTHAVLFTDKGVRGAGLCEQALAILEERHVLCDIIDSIVAEPSVYDVDKAIRQVEDPAVDLILAIGGGSTMDTAKLASVLLGASYTIFDLLNNASLAQKMVRTVMVPTTCGTGAEATCNAIVAIPEENTKKGIVTPALIPEEVILDVEMIAHLPASIVAATGVDALAHCVECFTGTKATMLSDTYAKAGASLIFHSIEKAYSDPDDLDAKMDMMLGSYYGGVAITGSGTTAVHALSYPLGGKYHIPHGVSNAILFANVMSFNREACIERMARLCDAVYPQMSGLSSDDKSLHLIERIAQIVKHTEIPVNLKKFGIEESDLDFLVASGFQQQRLLVNNPRPMTIDDIRSLYLSVL